MKKTPFYQSDPLHLFEDGTRACKWCGKHFYPSTKAKRDHNIYCSKECYEAAHKVLQKIWWQKHKDRKKEYNRRYYEKHGYPKYTPPKRVKEPEKLREAKEIYLYRLSFYRVQAIKKELVNLELCSAQFRKPRIKLSFKRWRKTSDRNKLRNQFIIAELDKRGLYDENRLHLDYDSGYQIDEHILD